MPLRLVRHFFWLLWRAILSLCLVVSMVCGCIGCCSSSHLNPNPTPSSIHRVRTCHRRRVRSTKVISRASTLENMCPDDPIEGNVEMDTHADTCVLGKNFIVLHYTGRVCDVYPYTDTYDGITGVPIVTGATAWTSPETGETFVLVVPESLWMPEKMPHSLINPACIWHIHSR